MQPLPWDPSPDPRRIFLNFQAGYLCHCCVQTGGTGAEEQETQGGGPPTLARPGAQEQQPALFGGLSGATSTSEPFRRSSCILSDLREDAWASVLSLTSQGQQGGAQGCSWRAAPPHRASSLPAALPLSCVPHGTRKMGPRRPASCLFSGILCSLLRARRKGL